MKAKSETSQLVKDFCAMGQTQFNTKIRTIRSDNGSEFISNPIRRFYGDNRIIHETSCTKSPQQNGRVQRKHRHVLNVVRALRFEANLPIEFWEECVLTIVHLINRTPTKVLN